MILVSALAYLWVISVCYLANEHFNLHWLTSPQLLDAVESEPP